jgi:hypothetical protein
MEQVVVVAVLALGSVHLLASLWSLVARPRPVYLAATVVGVALFSWLTVDSWLDIRDCNRLLAATQRYDLDSSGSGQRTIRIDALPGVDGFRVQLVQGHGRELLPVTLADLRWRGLEAAEFHQWDDSFLLMKRGAGNWLEVTYEVNDTTRPQIKGIHLEVTATGDRLKDTFVNRDISRVLAKIWAGAALICLAGFVAQAVKRSRAHRLDQR